MPKYLFVCKVRENDPLDYNWRNVYVYAKNPCHATNLAIRYCVESLDWPLNSFQVSKPYIIFNFIH